MIRYTSTQRQYRIWSSKRRGIFTRTAVTFDETKSGVHLLDEYPLIAMPALSANLPANLSSIGDAPRKRGRPQKETGPVTALLDSDAEDAIQPHKRARLFLKHPRPPPCADEVAMNVTEVSSKIVEPETYEEAIGDAIHGAH